MRILFVGFEIGRTQRPEPADLADHEHIGVVEMTGPREWRPRVLRETNVERHALPIVIDVGRRAPRLRPRRNVADEREKIFDVIVRQAQNIQPKGG